MFQHTLLPQYTYLYKESVMADFLKNNNQTGMEPDLRDMCQSY